MYGIITCRYVYTISCIFMNCKSSIELIIVTLTLGGVANSGLLGVCVFVLLFGSLEIQQSFTPDVHCVCREHISQNHGSLCRTYVEVCTGAQSSRGSWTGPQMCVQKYRFK